MKKQMRGWWRWGGQRSPFCQLEHSLACAVVCIRNVARKKNLPASCTELCIGQLVPSRAVYTSTQGRALLQSSFTAEGAPCQGVGSSNFSTVRDPCRGSMALLFSYYKSPKYHCVCVTYGAGKMKWKWLWKEPDTTLARARGKLNTFGALPCSKSGNLGKLSLLDIKTHFSRHLCSLSHSEENVNWTLEEMNCLFMLLRTENLILPARRGVPNLVEATFYDLLALCFWLLQSLISQKNVSKGFPQSYL